MRKISFFILLWVFLCMFFFSQDAFSNVSPDGKDGNVVTMYQDVVAQLQSGSYTKVDLLLAELLASKKMSIHGKRELEELYEELRLFSDETVLDKWCETSDSSPFPFVVRGNYFLNKVDSKFESLGIYYRSQDLPNETMSLLQKAQADLETAYRLNPLEPMSSSSMIAVCRYRGYPKQIMEQWFDKAIQADESWVSAYIEKFNYLNPYWYGSKKEYLDFALECNENSPKGSTVYTVLLAYFESMLPPHQSTCDLWLGASALYPEVYKILPSCIEKFKKEFPDSSLPLYYETLYQLRKPNNGTSLSIINRVLETEPANQEFRELRINHYLRNRMFQEAEKECYALLRIAPESPFALTTLGAIAIHLYGETERGQGLYDQGVSHQNSLRIVTKYLQDLGCILTKKQKYQAAVNAYTKLIDIRPRFEKAILKRGECKYLNGDISGAIEDMLLLSDNMAGKYKSTARAKIEKYRKELELTKSKSIQPQDSIAKKSGSSPDVKTADIKGQLDNHRTYAPELSVADQLDKCEALYYRKMKDEAVRCFTRLVEIAPDMAKPYFMLGKIAETIEYDMEKAAGFYGLAIIKDSKNQEYIFKLGEASYLQRQFGQAITVFSKLIELNHSHGRAYYLRGLCFDATGKQEEAIQDMQKAIVSDPGMAEARSYLQKYAMKMLPSAHISKADEILALAEENMRLNRYDQAEKNFNELLEIEPDNAYAFFRLGVLYSYRDRDNKKSIIFLDKAINLEQRKDYYYLRASKHRYLEQYDLAINDYTSVLSFEPDSHSVMSERGECYLKKGDYENAEKDFLSALTYDPSSPKYTNYLARLYFKTNKSIPATPENKKILLTRGKLYSSNKLLLAIKDLEAVLEIDPDNHEAYYHLGKVSQKQRDFPKAIKYLDKAIAIHANSDVYFYERGQLYYKQKQFEQARKDFSLAIKLKARDERLYYYRGNCNRILGNKDQAIKDYEKAKSIGTNWSAAINAQLEQMM